MSKNCLIIDVSRGTTHDGPGMRTTVFLKGCPLKCSWCQNPESIAVKNELIWEGLHCIGCSECIKVCPNGALKLTEDGIKIDREQCAVCGACIEACPSNSVAFVAKEWTVEELVREVKKDTHYYESFGGGVTVSGGEPLMQSEFVASFFRALKDNDIHCALDTCGQAPVSAIKRVLPFIDALLYDIKIIDSDKHKRFTGQNNEAILRNFIIAVDYIREQRLMGRNIQLWVRTPLVPNATATAENIKAISEFLYDKAYDVLDRWELCAFNAACRAKYDKMGLEWEYYNQKPMKQSIIELLLEETKLVGDKVLVSGIIATD